MIDSLKNELLQKQEETDNLQVVLCGKEEELKERQKQLNSQKDHITWLENVLQESKQHNEMLHASSTDEKNLVCSDSPFDFRADFWGRPSMAVRQRELHTALRFNISAGLRPESFFA